MLEALSDNIVIDKDKCIYCGICVNTCILDNLRMKLAPVRARVPAGGQLPGVRPADRARTGRGRPAGARGKTALPGSSQSAVLPALREPAATATAGGAGGQHSRPEALPDRAVRDRRSARSGSVRLRPGGSAAIVGCRPGRADGRLRPAAARSRGGPLRRGARTGRHAALGGAGVSSARPRSRIGRSGV